jgi:hypothetical protein
LHFYDFLQERLGTANGWTAGRHWFRRLETKTASLTRPSKYRPLTVHLDTYQHFAATRPTVMDGNQQYVSVEQMSSANKRDRRRQSLVQRLDELGDMFQQERDLHYSEMLQNLQMTLFTLHVGRNEEFLDEIADFEEARDENLVMLYLWEKYQMEASEREYEEAVAAANEEHESMTQMVKDRLMARLESQKKKLSEDRALLDIANDHSFNLAQGPMSALTAPGSPGGIGGLSSAFERRNLRGRRDYGEDSGMSGGEGGKSTAFMASDYGSSRRRGGGVGAGGIGGGSGYGAGGGNRTGASDAEAFSDRDLEGVLFAKEREAPTTRHSSKSYQCVRVLKPDEAMDDIMTIRAGVKKLMAEGAAVGHIS